MPAIKDVTVYYPTKDSLPPAEVGNIWYEYLLCGFSRVCYVQLDYMLDSINSVAYQQGITLFDVKMGDKYQRVVYDWSDKLFDPKDSGKILPIFKIQCPVESKDAMPIGQTVMLMEYFDELDSLRRLKDSRAYHHDIVGIFKATNLGTRLKAVELIHKQNWNSLIGLHAYDSLQRIPRELQQYRLAYQDHLRAQAKSKLVLVLPGMYDEGGFSWRLTEALGMGCAVIAPKHEAAYPAHRVFEKECIITIKPDLSDLVDKINFYLTHSTERERIAENGRRYFDAYLTPEAMAKRLVSVLRRRK